MSSQANQPLPEGFQLENYRVLRVLASGGFSFVYLAHDENETPVAIKEYLPATLALRTADINFFRANDTVYLVMRYERGRTLQEHIHKKIGPIKEDWIRGTFTQLLNGLREVHTNKLLHLDIKPGNIYVRNDGNPVLIDFGAARQTLTVDGMKLPPMYTPGFASPEHHREREKLGPWSDIYSIGATMYACLAGAGPPTALQRLEKDKMTSARKGWAGKYSAELLDTIDWCLRLDHLERPQSVLALQKALRGETAPGFRGEAPIMDQFKTAILRLTKRN
jgi:serine/threonine protein kinase